MPRCKQREAKEILLVNRCPSLKWKRLKNWFKTSGAFISGFFFNYWGHVPCLELSWSFLKPGFACLQKSWQCYQQNVAFLKMAVEIAKREKLSWRIEKVRLKSHGSKGKKHQEDFVADFLYIWPSLGFEAINIFESF